MSDEDRLPTRYRVISQFMLVYVGDDIDAAVQAFGQAISRILLVDPDPDDRVRVHESEHTVLKNREPLLEASILHAGRSRLAAVLYGATFDEFAERAPPALKEAIH